MDRFKPPALALLVDDRPDSTAVRCVTRRRLEKSSHGPPRGTNSPGFLKAMEVVRGTGP